MWWPWNTNRKRLAESEVEKGDKSKGATKTLRQQVSSIGGIEVGRLAVLSFRALQLYRIGVLQKKLVETQLALIRDETEPKEDIDDTIQRYANALRNYETLTQDIGSKGGKDYIFLGAGSADFDVVERAEGTPEISGGLWQEWGGKTVNPPPRLREIGRLGFRELDKRRRVERELAVAYWQRLRMAGFGGAALIVPMLIMALRPGLVVNLVTTSVATILFGTAAAFMLSGSSGQDVLASTAAYAAVLVVFVGASLTPGSSGTT